MGRCAASLAQPYSHVVFKKYQPRLTCCKVVGGVLQSETAMEEAPQCHRCSLRLKCILDALEICVSSIVYCFKYHSLGIAEGPLVFGERNWSHAMLPDLHFSTSPL